MIITEKIITELYHIINTEDSRKNFTNIPPYDIEKVLQGFIDYLDRNGLEITEKSK